MRQSVSNEEQFVSWAVFYMLDEEYSMCYDKVKGDARRDVHFGIYEPIIDYMEI